MKRHWEPSCGASDEWYTPKYVFDALGCQFDLDVAPAANGNGCVPANNGLGDGLTEPWFGLVWMNPPFGGRNAIEPWLAKFIEHGNGIALTPDRTSAPWFQKYAPRADVLRFIPKVRFLRPDGTPGVAPTNGTCLWAAGTKASRILRACRLGFSVVP